MPQITFKVTGAVNWDAAIVEETNGNLTTLVFNNGIANANVSGGGLAWFSYYARGNPGAKIEAEILKAGQPIVTKRIYKIDPDGSLARAIQFDPNA
jgi:hypothetical protein